MSGDFETGLTVFDSQPQGSVGVAAHIRIVDDHIVAMEDFSHRHLVALADVKEPMLVHYLGATGDDNPHSLLVATEFVDRFKQLGNTGIGKHKGFFVGLIAVQSGFGKHEVKHAAHSGHGVVYGDSYARSQ